MTNHVTRVRGRFAALAGALLFVAALAPAGAHARSSSGGRILVSFKPGAPRAQLLRSIGGRVDRVVPVLGTMVVSTSVGVPFAIDRLRKSGGVAYAEPNLTGRIAVMPNDTCIEGCQVPARQWSVGAVNAEAGWSIVPGTFYTQDEKRASSPVKIAVLDTKIDARHPDWINAFAGPSDSPWAAINGGQLDMEAATDTLLTNQEFTGPAAYHGTFVAGIAAAAANNSLGIAGIGYSASIIPVTVVDGNGAVNAADLASGIIYAWEHGARVINLSLGLGGYSQTVQDAIYTVSRPIDGRPGALVIAAAGNNASDSRFYPAAMDQVMAVAATDEADRPGACTNFGSKISVAAPGAGVVGLDPTSSSGLGIVPCGTSVATPHVSGLAALLFAQDPTRAPSTVRSIIESTADDANSKTGGFRFLGRDDFYGHGRIDVARALQRGRELREGLPALPQVDQLFATIPNAVNGTSIVTAVGRATGSKTITAAEWFFDRPGAPGTGSALEVSGEDSAGTQGLIASLRVPSDATAGVHRVFVRAKDADGWGAPSVAALIVDRTPPKLTNLQATNAVPAAGISSQITFDVGDDYSTQATYQVVVTPYVPGGSEPVFSSQPRTVDIPTTVTTAWMPALSEAGVYTITVTVFDQASNLARTTTNVVVV